MAATAKPANHQQQQALKTTPIINFPKLPSQPKKRRIKLFAETIPYIIRATARSKIIFIPALIKGGPDHKTPDHNRLSVGNKTPEKTKKPPAAGIGPEPLVLEKEIPKLPTVDRKRLGPQQPNSRTAPNSISIPIMPSVAMIPYIFDPCALKHNNPPLRMINMTLCVDFLLTKLLPKLPFAEASPNLNSQGPIELMTTKNFAKMVQSLNFAKCDPIFEIYDNYGPKLNVMSRKIQKMTILPFILQTAQNHKIFQT
ncbi:hypothetical protein LXL04_022693 [Taraxacum kok-saghyz]